MATDKCDAAILAAPCTPKKRGRPKTGKSAALRKREQIARDIAIISEKPSSEWPERACLMILSTSEKNPLYEYSRAAWEQIGKIRGF